MCSKNIDESLLLEKTRQELIAKSRSGRDYKDKSKGRNRWERRLKSRISNSVRDYNQINMDGLFKGDILEFGVKVQGETDNYVVTVIFENVIRNLQQEVKANNNKLEFKCVLRALLNSFNSGNIYIGCNCPDFRYRFSHHATENGYSSVMPEIRPNRFDWTNANDDMGSACKHVNLVISNLDWMMKIASVINNYIKYCKENMARNYADYLFPAIYGMPYNKAVQLSLFDDPDDNGYLLPDAKSIFNAETNTYEIDDTEAQNKLGDIIKDTALKGRDDKGRWTTDNPYKFKKQEPKRDTSQEDENALNLKFNKNAINAKINDREEEE